MRFHPERRPASDIHIKNGVSIEQALARLEQGA
jgi:hypothetical protein